jgi:hypothetical protein
MAATSEAPAPKLAIRISLWLAIYLAAQVPMIWRGSFCGEGYNIGAGLFLMPCALGMVVAIPLNLLPFAASQAIAGPVFTLGLVAAYLGYAWTLYAILSASPRRRFSFLLLIHVTMVLANQGIFWQMAHSISA